MRDLDPAPIGDTCGAHIATEIGPRPDAESREPVLCTAPAAPALVACPACGTTSARVRIERVVDDGLRFRATRGASTVAP